jgi:hypothetical protein
LKLEFEPMQEVSVPAEEAVRAGATVPEVDRQRRTRCLTPLDHLMYCDVLVPPAVLGGRQCGRIHDVGLHQDARLDEVLSFGRGQELGILADTHDMAPRLDRHVVASAPSDSANIPYNGVLTSAG